MTKPKDAITLADHYKQISAKGGQARAKKLTAKRRREIAASGGRAKGKGKS
jgi:hypothetical protein